MCWSIDNKAHCSHVIVSVIETDTFSHSDSKYPIGLDLLKSYVHPKSDQVFQTAQLHSFSGQARDASERWIYVSLEVRQFHCSSFHFNHESLFHQRCCNVVLCWTVLGQSTRTATGEINQTGAQNSSAYFVSSSLALECKVFERRCFFIFQTALGYISANGFIIRDFLHWCLPVLT